MRQAAWAARTLSAVRALTPPPKEGEHAAGAGGAGAACAGAAARAAWAAVGGPGALGRRWARIVHSLERAGAPDSPSLQRLPPLHTHLCTETRHLRVHQARAEHERELHQTDSGFKEPSPVAAEVLDGSAEGGGGERSLDRLERERDLLRPRPLLLASLPVVAVELGKSRLDERVQPLAAMILTKKRLVKLAEEGGGLLV